MSFPRTTTCERRLYWSSDLPPQGWAIASFARMVEVFGFPDGGGDKSDVEWTVDLDDETTVVLYNYRPDCGYGLRDLLSNPDERRTWRVCGSIWTDANRVNVLVDPLLDLPEGGDE